MKRTFKSEISKINAVALIIGAVLIIKTYDMHNIMLFFFILVFTWWMVQLKVSLKYIIDEETLTIDRGRFIKPKHIPIADIASIQKPSSVPVTMFGMNALGPTRTMMTIIYSGNRAVTISPCDRQIFLDVIKKKNEEIVITIN